MIAAAVFVSLCVMLDIPRRAPIYSACFLVATYVFISVVLLCGTVLWGWDNVLYNIEYEQKIVVGADTAFLIATMLSLTAWAASFARPPKPGSDLASEAGIPQIALPPWVTTLVLAVLTYMLVNHALALDWDKYWATTGYTEQKDAEEMMTIMFPPAVFFHRLMPIILVTTGATSLFLFSRKWPFHGFWAGGIFSYCWLYQFSAHSRWAAVSILISAVAYFLFRGRYRTVLLLTAIPIFMAAFIHARIGRITGQHGLSAIFSTWDYFDGANASNDLLGILYSVFQGIFAVAASSTISASYPVEYSILSFSPLPSFLDGFDQLYALYEVRVNSTNPLSGWIEALRFGWPYMLVLYLTIYVLLRLNAKLAKHSHAPLTITLSVLALALTMFLSAYNIRNVYRFILLVTAVHMWALSRRPSRKSGTSRLSPAP